MTAKRQPADTANRLTQTALLAITPIYNDPRVHSLPVAIRDRIVVKAAIGYLLENGLITEADGEEGWLTLGLPEWLEHDIADDHARMQAIAAKLPR